MEVSLLCPLGKIRMELPCKAFGCKHMQCFDAVTYLEMNMRVPSWLCPVCSKPAPFDLLFIDQDFQTILQSVKPDVLNIIMESNGSWRIPDINGSRELPPVKNLAGNDNKKGNVIDLTDDEEINVFQKTEAQQIFSPSDNSSRDLEPEYEFYREFINDYYSPKEIERGLPLTETVFRDFFGNVPPLPRANTNSNNGSKPLRARSNGKEEKRKNPPYVEVICLDSDDDEPSKKDHPEKIRKLETENSVPRTPNVKEVPSTIELPAEREDSPARTPLFEPISPPATNPSEQTPFTTENSLSPEITENMRQFQKEFHQSAGTNSFQNKDLGQYEYPPNIEKSNFWVHRTSNPSISQLRKDSMDHYRRNNQNVNIDANTNASNQNRLNANNQNPYPNPVSNSVTKDYFSPQTLNQIQPYPVYQPQQQQQYQPYHHTLNHSPNFVPATRQALYTPQNNNPNPNVLAPSSYSAQAHATPHGPLFYPATPYNNTGNIANPYPVYYQPQTNNPCHSQTQPRQIPPSLYQPSYPVKPQSPHLPAQPTNPEYSPQPTYYHQPGENTPSGFDPNFTFFDDFEDFSSGNLNNWGSRSPEKPDYYPPRKRRDNGAEEGYDHYYDQNNNS